MAAVAWTVLLVALMAFTGCGVRQQEKTYTITVRAVSSNGIEHDQKVTVHVLP